MKFEAIMSTTIDELMISTRGNQVAAAEIIGINRGTLCRYIANKDKIMLVQVDGKLTPFVCDRRNGHHNKKAN